MRFDMRFLVFLAALGVAPFAIGQDFPNRQIRIVVTTPAGATNDTIARMYAPRLSEQLKQPALIDNRMLELGAEPVDNSPEQSVAFVALQVERWAKVIKVSDAKATD